MKHFAKLYTNPLNSIAIDNAMQAQKREKKLKQIVQKKKKV